jgi:hypothetical protein
LDTDKLDRVTKIDEQIADPEADRVTVAAG